MTESYHDISLESLLDISKAESLHTSLKEAYDKHGAFQLQAGNVERITTPAIQILLSFFKTAEKEGKACQISSPSDAMTAAFADLGLTEELQSRVS